MMILWLEGATRTVTEERHLKHELRTPVNHIVGYGALLLETARDSGSEPVTQHALRIDNLARDLHLAVEGILQQTHRVDAVSTLLEVLSAATARAEEDLSQDRNCAVDESFFTDLRRISGATRRLQFLLDGAA